MSYLTPTSRPDVAGAGSSDDPPPSLHKRIDKGKGRMAPEEVEAMVREEEDRQLQAGEEPELGEESQLHLSAEEVEEDRLARLLCGASRPDGTLVGSAFPLHSLVDW
jgi:hypothetical protein